MDASDLAALDHATQLFAHTLGSLCPGELHRRTACGDWTVKDVANHVCGGALRYAHYLRGGVPEEIAWTRAADHVGDDPCAAHAHGSAELRTLFARPGAGAIRARHPAQTVSGTELLRMRVAELTVHSWDIASTLDPEATLDPTAADYLLNRGASMLQLQRARGYFADVPPAPDDATPAARLLALTGRVMPSDRS